MFDFIWRVPYHVITIHDSNNSMLILILGLRVPRGISAKRTFTAVDEHVTSGCIWKIAIWCWTSDTLCYSQIWIKNIIDYVAWNDADLEPFLAEKVRAGDRSPAVANVSWREITKRTFFLERLQGTGSSPLLRSPSRSLTLSLRWKPSKEVKGSPWVPRILPVMD